MSQKATNETAIRKALNNVGEFESAKTLLLDHEKEGEYDGIWHYRVGYSYYNLDEFEAAAEHFAKFKELTPEIFKDDVDAAVMLSYSYQAMGEYEKALETLSGFYDENNFSLNLEFAYVYSALGQYDKAKPHAAIALQTTKRIKDAAQTLFAICYLT